MSTSECYESQAKFWSMRNQWTVMGDWLGRLPALQLLNPQKGQRILDAGCGEGLLTRLIAESGAQVQGIDRSDAMLARAIQREQEDPRNISFGLRDITRSLPSPDDFLDAINCVAVLMHDSPEECTAFFGNAARVLKPGGRLVVSITHPYCYQPSSPTTDGRSKWTQFDQLESGSLDVSRKFVEHYRNIHGQVFDAEVWYHPEDLFPRLLQKAGLIVVKRQDNYVRPQDIAQSNLWEGSPCGHPAYLQFVAVKP